ncbi:DnaB-like helicase N-terminal domain-containing protein [Sporosarcina ureilytica]|uniref:DNA 5'-3' helicase n=1 Tax=Sporosarcina ureilytica TaxID=298596 RepID=A0A1D8JFE9_9BACL|nr:DnaB-like helicase N-terminal domain-containing protein [Sporosarcina ureilytica]AOV07431.1 hypothetical protein BI350_07685 [Sporosarcina ureilytica]
MIAEKAVLGAMLKENYLITESNLKVMQFTDPVNKMIFQSMLALRKAGKTVDMITLLTSYSPQDLGGANYLNDLTNYAHLEKFDDHVGELLDVWREREKKNVLHVSAHEDWSIDKITTELTALTDSRVSDHSDILSMLVGVYEEPFIEKEMKEGVPSGIDKLDDMTNGFQDGELTILAARPSAKKFALYLSEREEEARAEHRRIYGEVTYTVLDMSHKMDTSIYCEETKRWQSFRELKRQVVQFPYYVGEMCQSAKPFTVCSRE